MGNLFDAIKAALQNPKKGTDALADAPSVAGDIKSRRDDALTIADSDNPDETARRLRQHSDHTGNSGR